MDFYTPISILHKSIEVVRSSFQSGKTLSLHFRKQQLWRLYALLSENKLELQNAVYEDLRKSENEALMTEIAIAMNEVVDAIDNLDDWAAPEYPSKTMAFMMDKAYVRKDPYGVVLIIGAWNYPIQLTMVPLLSAIAAGNTVILKPSELAPQVAKCLTSLLPKYLDSECYKVVNGGPDETKKLLESRFNHIFYTGSGVVGKIVMTAAAKYLTPVTLELGGKSPCIVYDDCDPEVTAKRIVWGKFLNVGQTCIAPDYIICTPKMQNTLVRLIIDAIQENFGQDPELSPYYGRIINLRHLKRIQGYINQVEKSKIAFGGAVNEQDLYISPTLITNASEDYDIMKDEIFGPVLPFMVFDNMEDGLSFAKNRDQPLSLYVFTSSNETAQMVLNKIPSGNVCINDTVIQVGMPTLPFGGVGPSGMGSYHGKYGFDCFSHHRSVLHRSFWLESINKLRNPPYEPNKMKWLSRILFKKPRHRWNLLRFVTFRNLSFALIGCLLISNIYLAHQLSYKNR